MANATANYDAPSITYALDGGLTGSGVLDIARELKLRVKNWGYAWRMTKDTKWIDRAYTELNVSELFLPSSFFLSLSRPFLFGLDLNFAGLFSPKTSPYS